MASASSIRFLLGSEPVEVSSVDSNMTVLNYLRQHGGRRGTKEGCAEGDCGACTVVIGRLRGETVEYQAVNACIQFLPTLDGCQLVTVEDLQAKDGSLHPVQQSLLDHHGTQCGFCTPGFVMSMFAMYHGERPVNEQKVHAALAGNLCRCTGYGPIIDASKAVCSTPANDVFVSQCEKTVEKLKSLQRQQTFYFDSEGKQFIAPKTTEELATVYDQHPDAQILAGGTDVGLWVTKQLRQLERLIFVGNIEDLKTVEVINDQLEIGAGLSYSEAIPALESHFPQLIGMVGRIGSTQIRNMGTIGGNIVNGSPIGDMPPALIALNVKLVLNRGMVRRRISLEDFFIQYGKQDIAPGEFVEKIIIPLPEVGERTAVYKISKRFDQDISAVCGAFRIKLSKDQQTVEDIRIAFGGMAGIPARAKYVENALRGKAWCLDVVNTAAQNFSADYKPLSDMRASAEYRLAICKNLLLRFYMETIGTENIQLPRSGKGGGDV